MAPRDPSVVSHQLLPVPTYSRVPRHICICLHPKRTKRKTNQNTIKIQRNVIFLRVGKCWTILEQILISSWFVLDSVFSHRVGDKTILIAWHGCRWFRGSRSEEYADSSASARTSRWKCPVWRCYSKIR